MPHTEQRRKDSLVHFILENGSQEIIQHLQKKNPDWTSGKQREKEIKYKLLAKANLKHVWLKIGTMPGI